MSFGIVFWDNKSLMKNVSKIWIYFEFIPKYSFLISILSKETSKVLQQLQIMTSNWIMIALKTLNAY